MALNIDIHKNILIIILKDIFTNHEIGPYLGFKGGTAVLLFYDLSRFSVDLDFDLLNEQKETLVFNTIKKILEKHGTLKDYENKKYNLLYILSYHNKTEDSQNIKVEINKRNFGSKYEVKDYLGIPMKVMVKEDITANKLVAMHERISNTNRDIFDVWFFLSNHWPINKVIVEKRTNMKYKDFLQVCLTDLEKISERSILSGMGELLNAKQKDWVKKNLLNETKFQLKLAHNNES